MTNESSSQTATPNDKGYADLKSFFANVNTMFSIRNILAVDMMTATPAGGIAQRLQEIASVTKRIYAETTSPTVTNLLAKVEGGVAKTLDGWDAENIREMRRIHTHLAALPPNVYVAAVRAVNEGRRQHQEALNEDDWGKSSAYMKQVLDLYKKIGELKKQSFGAENPYEALLMGYGNDLKVSRIEGLYDKLQAPLTEMRNSVISKQGTTQPIGAGKELDKRTQMKFSQKLLEDMGFDFKRGALLVTSGSPYAGGTPDDVRVLVRTIAANDYYSFVKDSLYQGARAIYIQNLPQQWKNQPVGQHHGAMLMNAISLLFESVIGRSKAFGRYLEKNLEGFDMAHFEKTRRFIRSSAIRNGGDELSKISHDLIRYRIERDLMSGALDVSDLNERWTMEMQSTLGHTPANREEGPLQNPDWFTGRFGFIPTNTLSHIIAVALYDKLEKDFPDIETRIENGNMSFITEFLTKHIYAYGRSKGAVELAEKVIGANLNQDHLLAHFEDRYLDGRR